jgi:hypothetical protein
MSSSSLVSVCRCRGRRAIGRSHAARAGSGEGQTERGRVRLAAVLRDEEPLELVRSLGSRERTSLVRGLSRLIVSLDD